MDAHSFRCMAAELLCFLHGARVEKIYAPRHDALVLAVYVAGEKHRLVMRFDRATPLIFLADAAPSASLRPSAHIMRLRKYARGKRLGKGIQDFGMRRLAFPLMGSEEEGVWFLLLDMRDGACIVPVLPDDFVREPLWPREELIDSLCGRTWNKHDAEAAWQAYAVLTPLLRETLAALDPMEGRALMVDLETGGTELFAYAAGDAGEPAGPPLFYSAWPLPESLLRTRGLFPFFRSSWERPESSEARNALAAEYPVLHMVSLTDEPRFFVELVRGVQKAASEPWKKTEKRLRRLANTLEREEIRLRGMRQLREDALLLKEHIWRFAPDDHREEVLLSQEGGFGEERTGARRIALDPLRSVRKNMERMFYQSRRGERGLAMLGKRKEALALEREALGTARQDNGQSSPGERVALDHAPVPEKNEIGVGAAMERGEKSGKDAAVFSSSDGYVLLRGKNARGNQSLLRIGSPHDLWLHAEDGPSAHLIIRRAHAADLVPERTLREAAVLVGLRSWQRHDVRARIMVAELRHVRPVRGAAPGTVRVDSVLRSMTVSLREG